MTKEYKVDFSYLAPMWGDVIVPADDADEARDLAEDIIETSYPEAEEIDIRNVKEV